MSFPETVVLTPGEIMRTGTVQIAPLGTRGTTRDGRCFRYCKAGGAITPAMMVQSELPGIQMSCPQTSFTSPWLATFNTTVGTTWQSWQVRMSAALAAGALTKDTYKEGFIFVGSSGRAAASGQTWKIKTHTGVTASSTECVTFTIEDGEYPETKFTTDIGIGIVKNQYDDVIQVVGTAEPTSCVVGISPCTVTSGDFFWVQTWGRCVAAYGQAATVRAAVIPTTDAAQTGVGVGTSGTSVTLNQVIGYAPAPTVVNSYGVLDLKIAP